MCVHAGIRPGVDIESQDIRDLLWIREPFLKYRKLHPLKIIHGHTIVDDVEMHTNRIAVDTGAYKGGKLSAVYINGTDVEILQS